MYFSGFMAGFLVHRGFAKQHNLYLPTPTYEDIAWLADRVHDNATGQVRYEKVVDVMKAHCALPSSKVNYDDAGIKIGLVESTWGANKYEFTVKLNQKWLSKPLMQSIVEPAHAPAPSAALARS